MTDLDLLMTRRAVRASVQFVAAALVVAGAVLVSDSDGVVRSIGAALVGVVSLAAIKLALISLTSPRVRRLERLTRDLGAREETTPESVAVVQVEVDRLASSVEKLRVEIETVLTLDRRSESLIAEFATLRHEVLYLRETVARLDRSSG